MTPSFFFLSFCINALCGFLTTALLISALLFASRLPISRFRLLLLAIPPLKLVFDLFLYTPASWALAQGITPWDAEVGSRMLTIGSSLTSVFPGFQFFLTVHQEWTFSPGDVVCHLLPANALFPLVVSIVSVGTIRLLFLVSSFRKEQRQLIKLQKAASPLIGEEDAVFVSKELTIPLSWGFGTKGIFLPQGMVEQWTEEEKKAVLEHERAHLRYFDGWVVLGFRLLQTVFWWVPLGRWIRRWEHENELVCDAATSHPFACATAIKKTLEQLHTFSFSRVFQSNAFVKKRIRCLLTKKEKPRALWWASTLAAGWVSIGILFGRFWLF